MSLNKSVVVVNAQRTPIGSFMGSLSTIPATQLGAHAIESLFIESKIEKVLIEEVIMGQVLTAGCGQAPARQAALYAGLSQNTSCLTLNKVCGSGLQSVLLASDSLLLGRTEWAIAGGQENMSLSPHLLSKSRSGFRMGHTALSDSMIHDGLWDPYDQIHMGEAAELCAREYTFSRSQQDEFSKESYELAIEAQKNGLFEKEISPIKIENKGEVLSFNRDEEPLKANFSKMPTLKPAFDKNGTITAANASKINDGAAALLLSTEEQCLAKGIKPMARLIAQGAFAHEPRWFTTAPIGAIKSVLKKAQLNPSDIDLFEINEAFSVVALAAMKEFNIPRSKVNCNGGAIALGHPIGASGARILTTLIHALHNQQKRYGLATLCIGGGESLSIVVERI